MEALTLLQTRDYFGGCSQLSAHFLLSLHPCFLGKQRPLAEEEGHASDGVKGRVTGALSLLTRPWSPSQPSVFLVFQCLRWNPESIESSSSWTGPLHRAIFLTQDFDLLFLFSFFVKSYYVTHSAVKQSFF